MRRAAVAAVALGAVVLAAIACHAKDDCTCTVDQNTDRRVLACATTGCVGGLEFTCIDGKAQQTGSTCTQQPPAAVDATAPAPPDATPADTSCDDLRSFCSSSCARPATVAADCLSTASSGDPQQCAAWRATNGTLCRP